MLAHAGVREQQNGHIFAQAQAADGDRQHADRADHRNEEKKIVGPQGAAERAGDQKRGHGDDNLDQDRTGDIQKDDTLAVPENMDLSS